ncbi:MAG: WD40/YVTN/BNR-like repeat-containing protein, partial [Blastocatellia bacterium]
MRGRLARGRLSILLVGALVTLPVGSLGAPSGRLGSQTKQNEARVGARTDADDPDLPLVAHDSDKAQFLKLRGEYTGLLRGVPYHLPYNPRARAIQEMKRAESSLERERAAKMSGQNTVQLTGSAWTPIGPAPVPKGQTVGTPNPVSGRTTAIVINPTNPDIVYAGTAQGGVYRTLDGGATWTALLDQAET